TDLATGKPVALPTPEMRRAIIDAWRAAFPKAPKVMLIGDLDGLRYAIQHGCGWRADCLGDMGGFSRTWSHMRNMYPQQIRAAGAENAWKQAPVAWESCWDMRKWKAEGWDIRYIFDYALAQHASFVNNKSAPIPEGTRPEVERFLRRLGYRLVLKQLDHDSTAAPGGRLAVTGAWDNAGVAPPYGDYRIAVRLIPVGGGAAVTLPGTTSIRGWLPGARGSRDVFPLPKGMRPGAYRLAVGIVDPASHHPAVRLAVAGRAPDGWYPLSRLEIAR